MEGPVPLFSHALLSECLKDVQFSQLLDETIPIKSSSYILIDDRSSEEKPKSPSGSTKARLTPQQLYYELRRVGPILY
jgi:hypothetical protein